MIVARAWVQSLLGVGDEELDDDCRRRIRYAPRQRTGVCRQTASGARAGFNVAIGRWYFGDCCRETLP